MQAVVRAASGYLSSATSGSASSASAAVGGVGGLLVSGTVLGRGLDHLLRAVSSHATTAAGKTDPSTSSSAAVDADLLAALLLFALAALLDALDGHVARAYNQGSALGVVLDVVADNVLRSCLWLSAALLDARYALPAVGFVTCEWLTLLASQVRVRGKLGSCVVDSVVVHSFNQPHLPGRLAE